jgi:hypothetical protein
MSVTASPESGEKFHKNDGSLDVKAQLDSMEHQSQLKPLNWKQISHNFAGPK